MDLSVFFLDGLPSDILKSGSNQKEAPLISCVNTSIITILDL